jgi:predicted secreted hydrolase
LEFPADHGAHPGFRTEWWYYTGNLETEEGRLFGFQLTIFRRQISPPEANMRWPVPHSEWRTQQIYLGHAAISDISNNQHYSAEAIARGSMNLAGVSQNEKETTVFLKHWRIQIKTDRHYLAAVSENFALDLSLIPLKPIVLHGIEGYSRKGDSNDRASCYYSYTRLKTDGHIKINGRVHAVTGMGWMDHEFSTASLQPGIEGWDWFSLQLDNNEELMIYILRQADGELHPASSGTFVKANGEVRHLTAADFNIKVLSYWRSPNTEAIYPSQWHLIVSLYNTRLTIVSKMDDQEMLTPDSTNITYWEGSVAITGKTSGVSVTGRGYAELTGYAEKFTRLK